MHSTLLSWYAAVPFLLTVFIFLMQSEFLRFLTYDKTLEPWNHRIPWGFLRF